MDAGDMRRLAGAYGGDLSRWPAEARPAAEAWIARNPAEARSLLDEARALDHLLGAWPAPRAEDAVRARIEAEAAAHVRRARRRSWLLTLGGGVGLAAACLAGILAAPHLLDPPASPARVAAAPADTEAVVAEALAPWEAPAGEVETGASS